MDGVADALSDERRAEVWAALSDAFVDNEVAYDWIARRVVGVDRAVLRAIFFDEVAPYCAPNLMSPIPPVWAGFEPKALAAGIRAMRARNRVSRIARIRHRLFVVYLGHRFSEEWRAIEAALAQCRRPKAPTNSE